MIHCSISHTETHWLGLNFLTAMPIDVPDQPNGAQLPPQPNDPPTLTDLCNALMYNHRLRLSHQLELDCMNQNFASSDDVGRGVMYQAKLIWQAYAGQDVEAPAWLAPALAAGLAPVTRVAHKAYSLSCAPCISKYYLLSMGPYRRRNRTTSRR